MARIVQWCLMLFARLSDWVVRRSAGRQAGRQAGTESLKVRAEESRVALRRCSLDSFIVSAPRSAVVLLIRTTTTTTTTRRQHRKVVGNVALRRVAPSFRRKEIDISTLMPILAQSRSFSTGIVGQTTRHSLPKLHCSCQHRHR